MTVITARVTAADESNEKKLSQDVLDLALQDEEYGSKASIAELIDQARTFLFAGHDTTASTITWIYYYLSRNPSCLTKIKAEHDRIFGLDIDPLQIALKISADPKILAKLDYTLATMKEVLRLRPIGDGVRYPPKGYIIRHPNGAEFDTTGMILSIQHEGLHIKEDVWGPNAKEFDPERFMPGSAVPVGYMPFAQRPRDCIGRNLAYLEVSLWKYEVDLVDKSCDGAYCPQF
jgi:cytochrome P450